MMSKRDDRGILGEKRRRVEAAFYFWLIVVWTIFFSIGALLLKYAVTDEFYDSIFGSRPIVTAMSLIGLILLYGMLYRLANLLASELFASRTFSTLLPVGLKDIEPGSRHWVASLATILVLISFLLLIPWTGNQAIALLAPFVFFYGVILVRYSEQIARKEVEGGKEKEEKKAAAYDVIQNLMNDRMYRGQIVYKKDIEASEGRYGEFPKTGSPIDEVVIENFGHKPYLHQSNFWKYFKDGEDVFIVTPLGSGKTTVATLQAINWILSGNGNAIFVLPDAESADVYYKELLDTVVRWNQFGIIFNKKTLKDDIYDITGVEGQGSKTFIDADKISPDVVVITADAFRNEVKACIDNRSRISFLNMGQPLFIIDEVFAFPTEKLQGLALLFRYFNLLYRKKYNKLPRYILTSSVDFDNIDEVGKKLSGKSEISVIKADFSRTKSKKVHIWLPPMDVYVYKLGEAIVGLKRRDYIEELENLAASLLNMGENVLVIASGIPFSRDKKEEIYKAIREKFKNMNQQSDIKNEIKIVSNFYEISKEVAQNYSSIIVTGFHPYYYNIFDEVAHLGDNNSEGQNTNTVNIFVIPSDLPTDQFTMKNLREFVRVKGFKPQILLNDNDPEFLKLFLLQHIPHQGIDRAEFEELIRDPGVRSQLLNPEKESDAFLGKYYDKNFMKIFYRIRADVKDQLGRPFLWNRGITSYQIISLKKPDEVLGYVEVDRVNNIAMQGFILNINGKFYMVSEVSHQEKKVYVDDVGQGKVTYKFSSTEPVILDSEETTFTVSRISLGGPFDVPYEIVDFEGLTIKEHIGGYKTYPLGANIDEIKFTELDKKIERQVKSDGFMLVFDPQGIVEKASWVSETLQPRVMGEGAPFIDKDKKIFGDTKGNSYKKVLHTAAHAIYSAIQMIFPNDYDKLELKVVKAQIRSGNGQKEVYALLFHDVSYGIGVSKVVRKSIETILDLAYRILVSCPCSVGCPICIGVYRCPEKDDSFIPMEFVDAQLSTEGYYRFLDESNFDKLNAIVLLGSAVGALDKALMEKYMRQFGIPESDYIKQKVRDIFRILQDRLRFEMGGKNYNIAILPDDEPFLKIATGEEDFWESDCIGCYEPSKNRVSILRTLREEETFHVIPHEYTHAIEYKGKVIEENADLDDSDKKKNIVAQELYNIGGLKRIEELFLNSSFFEKFRNSTGVKLLDSEVEDIVEIFPIEGFAQWGGFKILEYYGLSYQILSSKFWGDMGYFRSQFIKKVESPEEGAEKSNGMALSSSELFDLVYKGGFMLFLYLEQNYGFNELLKFVVTGKLKDKELTQEEFEKILIESKVRDIL